MVSVSGRPLLQRSLPVGTSCFRLSPNACEGNDDDDDGNTDVEPVPVFVGISSFIVSDSTLLSSVTEVRVKNAQSKRFENHLLNGLHFAAQPCTSQNTKLTKQHPKYCRHSLI